MADSQPVQSGTAWQAVHDGLRPGAPRPFIVCRDNPAAFNGCEEYRLDEDGPPATFATSVDAEAVARLLNGAPCHAE